MLDSVLKIKDLMPYIKELGMPAVAMTDHGVMHGIVDFYDNAKANELKPILGVEAYLTKNHKIKAGRPVKGDWDTAFFHLILLAKNFEGYRNLLKLVSIANTKGFYYKPRIDKKLLRKYSAGLIATSACYGGEIPQSLIKNKGNKDLAIESASKIVSEYKEIFGEDFYIEIQRGTSGEIEKEIDPLLIQLSELTKTKLVATCDVHYLKKEYAEIQDMLWALNEGLTIDHPKHHKMETEELYVKSSAEMYELFKDIPYAVSNTLEIVDKITDYEIKFDRVQPVFLDLDKARGETAESRLRGEAFAGAIKRYGKIDKRIEERLNYELKVIHDKGYDDYFLIVSDYVKWCKANDILVGPGRGSGPASVVAYCIEITNIDPFWWELEFERFLNPFRPSPPDFDIDFQDDRRGEVIKYIEQKYGRDKVSAICAIGRMDTKAAIRDISRVMGIPLEYADKIAKMIPVKRGKPIPIMEAMETIEEFRDFVNSDPKLVKMVNAVSKIKKLARHVSVHACGYLITPTPLTDYVPIRRSPQSPDLIITQIEGAPLEPLGLMKFDFLGLRTLTIIKHILVAIKENHGETVDIDTIPLDDKYTFEIYKRALTDGIFQFESTGMKKFLKELKPERIQDINFLCAAYRPGPMQYIPSYINRKFGREKTEFLHPDLEPILGETYGYAIYQEQLLRIAVRLAGYSVGEADILRRAIGKKKLDVLEKEKVRFEEGMIKNGYTKELSDKVWEYMIPFADYGFNKAHSACYAVLSYQTAYLKAHHPVEFMIGMLQADYNKPDKLEKDLQVALDMNIRVITPDINKSKYEFAIESHNAELEDKWMDLKKGKDITLGIIRYGFSGIKGLSHKASEEIVRERTANGEYKHLDDLLSRVSLEKVNKKSLILLAQAGAFEEFGERNAIIKAIEKLYDRYKVDQKNRSSEQRTLFGDLPAINNLTQATPLPNTEPCTVTQILAWEKSLFGVYVTSHPLSEISDLVGRLGAISIAEAKAKMPKEKIKLVIQILRMKKHTTKNGDPMAFIDSEDISDSISIVIFPTVYKRLQQILEDDKELKEPYIVIGRIDKKLDNFNFIADTFERINLEENCNKECTMGKSESDVDASIGKVNEVVLYVKRSISRDELLELKDYMAKIPSNGVTLYFVLKEGSPRTKYSRTIEFADEIKMELEKYGRIEVLS